MAYRMLGSLTEADDAVQDAWLRLSRSGADDVEDLGGTIADPERVRGIAAAVLTAG